MWHCVRHRNELHHVALCCSCTMCHCVAVCERVARFVIVLQCVAQDAFELVQLLQWVAVCCRVFAEESLWLVHIQSV